MHMTDLYLRANDESTMISALIAAGFTHDTDTGVFYEASSAIDVIGEILRPTDEAPLIDGEPVPAFEKVPGYHVNVRTTSDAVAAQLAHLKTAPATPLRVWA
ncbi:hypothetical protein HG555_09525 [Aeromonas sp. DNRA1]|nr:hypothetical protein [Aeromonas sp. DNRA1]